MSIIENSIGISLDTTQKFNEASVLMPRDADNLTIKPSKNQDTIWIQYSNTSPIYSQCFYHIIMTKHKDNAESYTYLGKYSGFYVFYKKEG